MPLEGEHLGFDKPLPGAAEPVGQKGIGEVAAVGVAPAIANAIFHATGRRLRDLPITPEKLLWKRALSRRAEDPT